MLQILVPSSRAFPPRPPAQRFHTLSSPQSSSIPRQGHVDCIPSLEGAALEFKCAFGRCRRRRPPSPPTLGLLAPGGAVGGAAAACERHSPAALPCLHALTPSGAPPSRLGLSSDPWRPSDFYARCLGV